MATQNDLVKAVDFITMVLDNGKRSSHEMRGIALDLLDGSLEMRGGWEDNRPSKDLGVFEAGDPPQKGKISAWNEQIIERLKEKDRIFQVLSAKLQCIAENLPERYRQQIDRVWAVDKESYCDPDILKPEEGSIFGGNAPKPALRSGTNETLLDSFLHMRRHETGEDYGWLFPNGKFFAVEWGDYQDWARKWLEKNDKEYKQNGSPYAADDWLCEKHRAILIHSPSHGVPVVTALTTQSLTRAQEEWLYEYYMRLGLPEKASEIYPKED